MHKTLIHLFLDYYYYYCPGVPGSVLLEDKNGDTIIGYSRYTILESATSIYDANEKAVQWNEQCKQLTT